MNEKKRPAKRVQQAAKVPVKPTAKNKKPKREGKSIRWMLQSHS